MRLAEKSAPDPRIVIIDIDEKSLAKIGQWPWPHTIMADLVNKVLDNGALAIGLDIIFAEPDRTSPIVLKKQLQSRLGIDLNLEAIPQNYLDNDQYLRDAILNKPVVLGAFAEPEGITPESLPEGIDAFEFKDSAEYVGMERLKNYKSLLLPMEILFEAAPVGIVSADVDRDRMIRTVPMLILIEDNIYASLSLRTLMTALQVDKIFIKSSFDGLESIQLGDITFPIDYQGVLHPFYKGKARTFPYYSATDVLDGLIGKDELEGKIVFIGASATGLMDVRATPLDMNIPGVEVHATLVDNILNSQHISLPYHDISIQVAVIVGLAFLSYMLFSFTPALISVSIAFLALAGLLWGSFILFENGIFLSPFYAIIAITLMGSLVLPYRFWAEQKAKKQIRDAFGHYVSPEVVKRIAASDSKILNGENKEVSILFTDVRNFTSISEKMAPDQLVRMLNSYFTPMTACVRETSGTLDKFIGDALMAFWNAPLKVKNHQKKAVLAAMAMQKKLESLRQKFIDEFGAEIRIGAGIHSGIAQVGSMGSDDLRNYTCIGDNVNLASRLESLSKRYGAGIIVSSAVMEKCSDIRFRHLDRITVKGSSKPLDIFTPLDNDKEWDMKLEHQWEEALHAYFQGNFSEAVKLFSCLLSDESMKTAAKLFIDRCSWLLENPPSSWNGVWSYDTK